MRCLYCNKAIGPLRLLRDREFCSESHRSEHQERFRRKLRELLAPEPEPMRMADFDKRTTAGAEAVYHARTVLTLPSTYSLFEPNWQGHVTMARAAAAGVVLQSAGSASAIPQASYNPVLGVACLEPNLPVCGQSWKPGAAGFAGITEEEPRTQPAHSPACMFEYASRRRSVSEPAYLRRIERVSHPALAAAQTTAPAALAGAADVPTGLLEPAPAIQALAALRTWSTERAAQPVLASAPAAGTMANGAHAIGPPDVPTGRLELVPATREFAAFPNWSTERAAQPVLSSAPAAGIVANGAQVIGAPRSLESLATAVSEPQATALSLGPAAEPVLSAAGALMPLLSAPAAPAFPVAIESRGPSHLQVTVPNTPAAIAEFQPVSLAEPLDLPAAPRYGLATPASAKAGARALRAPTLPPMHEPLSDESHSPSIPEAAPLAQPWSAPQLASPPAAYPWWPARPTAFAELDFPLVRPRTGVLPVPSAEREPLAGPIILPAEKMPLLAATGRRVPSANDERRAVQTAALLPVISLQPARAKLTELLPGAHLLYDPQQHKAAKSKVREFPRRRGLASRSTRVVQFAGAMAAALLLAGVLWPRGGLHTAAKLMSFNGDSVRQAIASRATRTLADNFQEGLRDWKGLDTSALKTWSRNPDGYMRPGQLGLYAPSLKLADYRVEFLAQIENKSVDWVVRAHDTSNYYAVKFNIVQPGPRPLVDIVRYPVVKGKRGPRVTTPLRIMIHANTAYWVAVDVHGNQFRTFIDGQPADYWTDDHLKSGGVGFFSEAGERARIYSVKIESNDDLLGRVCALLARKNSPSTNHTETLAMDYRFSAPKEVMPEPHANSTQNGGDPAQNARLGKVLSKAASLHLEDKREEAVEVLRAAIDEGERHPSLYFAMGQLQYELQDYESAAQSYAQAAMLQPLHPTAHFNTGVCLGRLERWEESAEFFRVALANDPSRMEAHLALGACLVRLGKQNEAIESYDRYLTRYPEHEEALFGKAVALQKHDRHTEASELYRRILARNPRSAEALSNLVSLSLSAQDHEQVQQHAGKLADLHPRSQVALEGLAAAAFAKGDHAAAAEYSRKLAEIAPQVFENWFNLGVACHKSGDLRTATEAYARATRIKPDSAQAHLNLGVALHETNDLKGAKDAYQEALNLDSDLAGVHWNLGLVHEQSGDFPAAESFYAQVPENSPDYEDALFRMGHLKLQRAELAGSIRAFQACLQRRPDWPEARLNLGISHWRSGDKDAARVCFQDLNASGAESKEALRGLAALALERQEYDKAFDIYHQLIDAGDRTPELLYNAALICQKRGQAGEAATLYREAIKADPGFGEALLNLGHALMSMGDEFEARSCWRRAVLAKPELAQHYFEPVEA